MSPETSGANPVAPGASAVTKPRVAVPSGGRLRNDVLALLQHAGYRTGGLGGNGARADAGELELIEMRPRDAGVWLATGRVQGAFVSTDIVMEEGLSHLASVPLGFSQSDLVVASREDDGRDKPADLAGAIVATHLPKATKAWFAEQGIDATVVAMGGSLEGVCAAGMAEAIVDLRETGNSLRQNRLRALATIARCQALFVYTEAPGLEDLRLRLQAALDGRQLRYVMLHLPPQHLDRLRSILPGLASPTVLPLAGRDDLIAVHIVVDRATFWARLGDLRDAGATGIVALAPDALLKG